MPRCPTSLFTVCQSQPGFPATSSTELRHLAGHPPSGSEVNNARSGAIVGSCSKNGPSINQDSGISGDVSATGAVADSQGG